MPQHVVGLSGRIMQVYPHVRVGPALAAIVPAHHPHTALLILRGFDDIFTIGFDKGDVDTVERGAAHGANAGTNSAHNCA